MLERPNYKACWKHMSIFMPNGAHSFARCTLLVLPGYAHEGPCKFAYTVYELIKSERTTL